MRDSPRAPARLLQDDTTFGRSPREVTSAETVAWYNNEHGFTSQMIRTLEKFAHL